MSRKSAADGWNQVRCCFFNDLYGKGNINVFRMREETSGEGDRERDRDRDSVCVCCDPQCKEQALQ